MTPLVIQGVSAHVVRIVSAVFATGTTVILLTDYFVDKRKRCSF